MRWRWFIIVGCATIAVFVAALALLRVVDLTSREDQIASFASSLLGRKLEIHGGLSVGISLWPELVAEDVRLANAEWGTQPTMLDINTVEITLALWPLLLGTVDVSDVDVIGARLSLETNEHGVGNWDLGAHQERLHCEVRRAVHRPEVLAESVSIEDLEIHHRDGKSGETDSFTVTQLTVSAADLKQPITFDGVGRFAEQEVEASGRLGSLSDLLSTKPFSLALEARAAGATLVVNSTVAHPPAFDGLKLHVSAKSPDLAALPLPADLPKLGAFDLEASLQGADGVLSIDPVTLHLYVGSGSLTIHGTVADARRIDGLKLEVSAKGPDVTVWRLPFDLPELGAFDVEGSLRGTDGVLVMDPVTFKIGRSDIAGSVRLEPIQQYRVTAHVKSGTIDVEPWLHQSDGENEESADITVPPGGKLFPHDSLGLDALNYVAADVTLDLDQVLARGARLEVAQAELTLDEGRLRLAPFRAVFRGTTINGLLDIDVAPPAAPTVHMQVLAQDLDFGDLLARLEVTDRVKAFVDIGVHVNGAGNSVAAILASLDGKVAAAVSQGEIPTSYLDPLVANLAALLMPWAHPPEMTEIKCAVVQFDIESGAAHTQVLMFDTKRLTLSAKGDIDLRNETLHLDLAPRPRDQQLLKLATDVRLTGSLTAPKARPHPIGIASTFVRFVLGPAELLMPFDLLGAERHHPCVNEVQTIGAPPTASSPLKKSGHPSTGSG